MWNLGDVGRAGGAVIAALGSDIQSLRLRPGKWQSAFDVASKCVDARFVKVEAWRDHTEGTDFWWFADLNLLSRNT
ncbi:hypothetical protein [Burkholderia sp. BCC0044]|uniref:hypothetical protein n=1 Tax=Burkholderia sp. BCC0044 TaxID=2676295 RepID=UPI0015884BE3|nr:hypothetical protein [Burkholderia sp. BCC0044]